MAADKSDDTQGLRAADSGDKAASKNTLYCSFCGKSQHEVRKLIAAKDVYICDECVELCMDIVRKETKPTFDTPAVVRDGEQEFVRRCHEIVPNSNEMARALFTVVAASTGAANGVSRGARVLLCGPFGGGKSLLARDVLAGLDRPWFDVDATTFRHSENSVVSSTPPMLGLLQAADYNVERAQRGVVLIEHLELLANREREYNARAQDDLFALLNINIASVPPQGGRKHPQQEYLQVAVRGVGFVATCQLPFHYDERLPQRWDFHPEARNVESPRDKLIACGFSADLIHSFDSIVMCPQPSTEDMLAYIQQQGEKFFRTALGASSALLEPLKLSEEAAESLARLASERRGGYRSLLSLGAMLALRALFEGPGGKTNAVSVDAVNDLRKY